MKFTDNHMKKLLEDLKIKQHITSLDNPQINVQANAINQVVLRGPKITLESIKGNWADELPHFLWAST